LIINPRSSRAHQQRAADMQRMQYNNVPVADVATEELEALKAAYFKTLAHPIRIRMLD
jgi:hypothetical protein